MEAPDGLAVDVSKALDKYGPEVVGKSWEYAKELLPLFEAVVWLEELKAHSIKHNVTRLQVLDAIALLGYLRQSGNEHNAWLAAQLVGANCQNPQNFLAAATTAIATLEPPDPTH